MPTEIERKFLIDNLDFKKLASGKKHIKQGFLNTHPKRTVRVRVIGAEAYITVKGIGNASGTTRFEWERAIPVVEANSLFPLCEANVLEKMRYEVPVGKHFFEVDEFLGENLGLIIAEVELSHEEELFEKPSWLGIEVTGETKYYNSQLSINPYKQWEFL